MNHDRKTRERQQRRQILLEAAVQVFGRKPFDEATMQEVAAEAQIGMQGLYEHFPSKQELYEQVVLHRAEQFRARAETALAAAADSPLARLEALATVYVGQFSERPMFLPMFVRDRGIFDWGLDSRFNTLFKDIYREERGRLRSIIEEAVARGMLRPLDPDFLAQLCLDVLQASLHHSHRNQTNEAVGACVQRAMDCFLNGAGGRS